MRSDVFGEVGARGQEAGNLVHQLAGGATALLQDLNDVAVEAAAVVRREVFGGADDDRNVPAVGAALQLFHESEPIHLRHQEVQQNDAGHLSGDAFEADFSVLRFNDSAPLLLGGPAQHLAGIGVILND